MLTDPKLRSQVDQLWDKLWTGGLTNPLDAIEQLSYLIFLKRLDDEEDRREKQAKRRGQPYQSRLPEDMRWRHWTHFQAQRALDHVREKLFPWFRTIGRIWFYDMAHDGFSLDDKRQPVAENDIPDLLACWHNRHDPDFQAERQVRIEQLKAELAPLKADRLAHLAEINRLTFESVIAQDPTGFENLSGLDPLDAAKTELAELESQIAPLQSQVDQLTRQFWVSKQEVKANNYDLSASRYREVDQDEAYYEKPQVTMQRIMTLEQVMRDEVAELGMWLDGIS